ncbi:keratin-associated protein 9-1-like isoform X2 [Corticium candelabrum]|uniref:keratin-associated protein 9-1-like isoform X2 n=1 Tax=Corticium candelabrum TaxID=121492 RepID=UPI002E25D8EC|nr:keratin-associated protein 9-1-like isoform X2 [Corticium candelabrum]
MARLCSRLICTVTLFSVLSVTLNVSDAKPLSLTRSKRQSDCNNTYSQCECGVQYRAVLDKVGTSTVTSRVEYKLCRMTCPSGEQQPLPRLTKLTASASSYQLQCSCKAGFQYHQRTGCCRNACHNLNCKSYQKCSVRLSAVYCEDTCTGYPNCGQGQECYLRAGTTCHYVGGVTVCPQIAACRYTDPCFQCKSYQRCIRGLRNVICEDTCEGYPGCKKGEECYLYRPSFCYFGSCQNIAACRRIDPCATVQCTYYQSCHVHNGTGYCRDSCFRNGPCHSNRQCQLVDQNCNGRLPCPKRAVCGKPACAGYTYTLRTNRRQSIVNYPQRRITSCGQFEGSFTLIATNGLCIKVTADLGSRDTKSGELIRVHDGDINSRQLFQGSSLRGTTLCYIV